MYTLNFDIQIGNKQKVRTLTSVVIKRSVENMADTAVITLPGIHYNKTLNIEDLIKVDDPVEIRLGYEDDPRKLPLEFAGYIESITSDETSIKINCTDEFRMFRQPLENKNYEDTPLEDLLKDILPQIGSYTLRCDYDFSYDYFTIHQMSGEKLLSKIQQDTRANIWFEGKEMHVHPHFSEAGPKVIYDFAVNVEKADMNNNKAEKEQIWIIVEGNDDRGNTVAVTRGKQGGREITVRMEGVHQVKALAMRAEEELRIQEASEAQGTLTGWLIPYVAPGYLAEIRDEDYPQREGTFYVISVETSFSEKGGIRKVTFGKKIE